jgi:hypothetical protein
VAARWLVARRDQPDRPLVAVRLERPWFFLGLVARADVEPLVAGDGEKWAHVVQQSLDVAPLVDPANGRPLEPPHGRSAHQLGVAMRALATTVPGLVAWEEGTPAPLAHPAPPAARATSVADHTCRRLVDEVAAAFGRAEKRGDKTPDDRAVLASLVDARDEAALVTRLRALGAVAKARPVLAEELRAVPGRLDTSGGVAVPLDGAVLSRLLQALSNS